MSDDTDNSTGDGSDELADIEALLRELDDDDLQPSTPPEAVWSNIEAAIAEPAAVVPIEGRSRRRAWLLAAAAVLVVAIAGAVVASVVGDDESEVVSTAVLAHDPDAFDPRGSGSTATANLVERNGRFEIELTDADLPALTDDDLELWLIEPDDEGNPVDVQPVAVIDSSDPGAYPVPAGLDPSSHYVVDISIEPRDGDDAHSGQSILRGPLASV
ncbi:MAG TPA: anti-sigma factor [Ilumatobacteraceae bacterium]